jgi:hypothetical protein
VSGSWSLEFRRLEIGHRKAGNAQAVAIFDVDDGSEKAGDLEKTSLRHDAALQLDGPGQLREFTDGESLHVDPRLRRVPFHDEPPVLVGSCQSCDSCGFRITC